MANNLPAPALATHHWVRNDGFKHPVIRRLNYYYKEDDNWMVYSEITGWRLSHNEPEWFEEETRLGFFKEIDG